MKSAMKLLGFLLVTCVVLSACGSAKRQGPHAGESNIITETEIKEALEKRPILNALELITYLRPKYLAPRTQPSVNRGIIQVEPVVYINNSRFGQIAELQNIGAQQIVKIEYLKGTEATYRLGLGHEGGAILVSTR